MQLSSDQNLRCYGVSAMNWVIWRKLIILKLEKINHFKMQIRNLYELYNNKACALEIPQSNTDISHWYDR